MTPFNVSSKLPKSKTRRDVAGDIRGGGAQSRNPNATIKPFSNSKTPKSVVGDWKRAAADNQAEELGE